MRTLVTGGVKSGKSRRALEIVRSEFSGNVAFVATAEVFDDELRERVERHRRERKETFADVEFRTIEEPVELGDAIREAGTAAVVDCLPLWINNLMHYGREADFASILGDFIEHLPLDCVIVTNETGLGNIPFDEATRRYNRLLAEANVAVAAAADRVELMVAGLPLRVK